MLKNQATAIEPATAKGKKQEPLYITDIKGTTFTKIDVGVGTIKSCDVALNGSYIAYVGSSLLNPPKLYGFGAGTKEKKLIFDPTAEQYKDIVLTKTDDFNFKNKCGLEIEGWLDYPANFDPAKKYPLIVYYYGGTEPTEGVMAAL